MSANLSEHGILKTYKKQCRCGECKAANASYQRDYQARRKIGDIKKRGVKRHVPQEIDNEPTATSGT